MESNGHIIYNTLVIYSLNQWIHEAMFALCKSWMMEKSYNYKYPSVLECAQAVTMPCAKYFDKQTYILVRNAIMLFLSWRRAR